MNLIKRFSKNITNISLRHFSTTKILRNEIKNNKNNQNQIVYTNSDEWIYNEKKYKKIGLTKNAIDQLTELVYVDFLKEPGDYVKHDEELVAIESVKATGTINAPYDLKLIDNNLTLEEDLNIINDEPENIHTSWFIKVSKS